MELPIITTKEYTILEADKTVLNELSTFIVTENYKHHAESDMHSITNDIIAGVYQEEYRLYELSRILIVRSKSGEMIGSIRATLWDNKTMLPLEKIFGINPMRMGFSQGVTKFWHIGRFAICKGKTDSSLPLMKTLMAFAIKPIIQEGTGCLLAEVDRKLFNVLGKLGIIAHQIAPSVHYLASETIPIYSTSEGLESFYRSNKYLYV